MPINSSINPSYVSWVSKGVIISTFRSRIINESNLPVGIEGSSENGSDCLFNNFARRCETDKLLNLCLNSFTSNTYWCTISLANYAGKCSVQFLKSDQRLCRIVYTCLVAILHETDQTSSIWMIKYAFYSPPKFPWTRCHFLTIKRHLTTG
jgi:hypothetical protein